MMTTRATPYRGRFAPSPTGPLHFGSVVAAVGSFVQARHAGGEWLVRIDDLDAPRSVAGTDQRILKDLELLGLHWDGEIVRQSARGSLYENALETLQELGLTYPCGCSRKDLRGGIYPGFCRDGLAPGKRPRSRRIRTDDTEIELLDRVQGSSRQNLSRSVGDFVVLRTDGQFAYHLATAVDDSLQGMTEVVRGSDLLDSTLRQLYLQRMLGLHSPAYAHLPVAVNHHGQKLSKQTHAAAIDPSEAATLWLRSLEFLGQKPPRMLRDATPEEVRTWAITHWQLDSVPRTRAIRAQD